MINFGEYGLYAEKKIIKNQFNDPIYIVSFAKEPDYFEVSTRDAAVSEIKHVGSKKYSIQFIASGGNIPIECSFKIQAY